MGPVEPGSRDQDGLGSLVGTTTGPTTRYWPSGEPREPQGELPTDRRFTGQRLEASTGLYDYQARFYNPQLGRFLQPDTLVPEPSNPQSLNRYAYALNNPLKYVDRDGHLAVIPLVLAGVFLAYDAYQAYQAFQDPESTELDRSLAVVALGLDVVPGGGQVAGKILKAAAKEALEQGAKASAKEAVLATLQQNVPIGRDLGQWVQNRPRMSDAARAFQRYVTGAEAGFEFLRNGVHFDGLRLTEAGEAVLLDAKYAGAAGDSLFSKVGELPFAKQQVLGEAHRQLLAAGGLRIEWHVSDQTAWQALQDLFEREGIGIDVIYTPWTP